MPTVTLYETNSDLILAQKDDGPIWEFGVVTADMYGQFAEDAAAWCDGDWEPGETDGQHVAPSDDGLDAVVVWDGGERKVSYLVDPEMIGGAARLYVTGNDN